MPARLLLIVSLVVAAAACASPSSNAPYKAEDLGTGKPVSTVDLRGHPVLLVSWETWCKECKTELPALEHYYEANTSGPLRIVLVNVNSSDSRKEIDDIVTRYHLSMTQWRDRDNDFETRFGTVGVPTAVLLDRAGKVVKTWPGAINPNGTELAGALRGT